MLEGRKAAGQADAVSERRRTLDPARRQGHQPCRRGGHTAQPGADRAASHDARRHRRVRRRPRLGTPAAGCRRISIRPDSRRSPALALVTASAAESGPLRPRRPELHLVRSTPHPKLAEARGRVSDAEADAARAQDAAAAADRRRTARAHRGRSGAHAAGRGRTRAEIGKGRSRSRRDRAQDPPGRSARCGRRPPPPR